VPGYIVNNRSTLYKTAVELYTRHRPDAGEWCAKCEQVTCLIRQHAATVIRAAGLDAALYDSPPRRPDATHWSQQPTANLPVYRRSDNRL
jgi:hypothetical protein